MSLHFGGDVGVWVNDGAVGGVASGDIVLMKSSLFWICLGVRLLSTFFSFQYLELFGHIDPVRDATGIDSIMVGYNRVLFDVEPLVCRGFLKACRGLFYKNLF